MLLVFPLLSNGLFRPILYKLFLLLFYFYFFNYKYIHCQKKAIKNNNKKMMAIPVACWSFFFWEGGWDAATSTPLMATHLVVGGGEGVLACQYECGLHFLSKHVVSSLCSVLVFEK
jgi:hypothetical protein